MTQDSVTLHGHYDENGLVVLTSPHARHPIRCRPNTSDLSVFRQVFIEREYRCLDEVSEAGLVVDCGANAGYSAAYFLTRFPNCSLIAVEPDPDNAHLLRLNLAPYGNAVRIIESAVWSHPARLTLADTEYRDGGAWARQVRECGPEEPTSFTAIDINQLLAESGHERIAILKMDIEGAEAVVFSANLHPWLDRVDNLVVELHDDTIFGNASVVFNRAIAGQGFTVTRCGELTVCKRPAKDETMNETGRTADEWNAIGIGHAQQGNRIEACAAFQRAAEIDPNSAPFHYNLGIARQNLGYIEEAATSYRRALELKPDHVNALTNLGTLLVAQMQLDEAVACCRRALELTPNDAEVHNNLGAALFEQGKAEEAAACYRRALALRPDYPEANNNLGVALHRQGKFDEAIACYRRTLERNLNDPMAHNFLGAALQAQRKLDEAIACYRQALALNPDYAAAHNNLGAALFEQGDVDAAIACGRRALELMPDDAGAHSSLIFMMYYHPRYDSQAIHDECRRWNQRHAEPLRRSIRPHLNSRDPERKLRIGYVSPDFYDHVLSCFTIPLLANHDRRQFEIYCYANVKAPDAVTEQVRRFAAVWRDTVGLSDQRLAELIREDRIDILVELTMHAENNRLLVFARKPAPVQVAWLGINGTTGLSTIDYRLTDPYLDPPGPGDAVYSEKSLRLPDTFWCYRPLIDPPAVNPLPFDQNGYWTFGCLNNFVKVNDGTLELWAKVLRAVPGSRLLLLAPQGQARNRVSAKLKHEGIAEDRLEFCERTTRPGYFQLYSKIDFCLDTTPYNSHTTSLDAFTMGVPTVTLIGRTVVGREGWSQLRNLGLGELAATTAEQFVEIAISLANDPPRLRRLRETLRPRMIASPLMDADRFARNIEQAFREMWRAWEKEPRTE